MRTAYLNQPTYIPGKPTEAVAAEFNIPADEIIKLASNENPWGASPNAIREGKSILQNIHLYPDGSGSELAKQYHQNSIYPRTDYFRKWVQ